MTEVLTVSADVIPLPKGRQVVRGSPGAGGANAPPVASVTPDWLAEVVDRLSSWGQADPTSFDGTGVLACSEFLNSGVNHMVDAFGLDRALVCRWFPVAVAHELLKAAGGQSAMVQLLRLAAYCQGAPGDGPRAA